MAKDYVFTSESVSEGHPDKVADQISDAVLDAILIQDPDPQHARVACETMIKTGAVIVGGEITTNAWIDLDEVVRKVVCDIGYTSSHVGFDGSTCAVMSLIGKQSSDIAQGVDRSAPEEQGAGDQGLMFGYATNETDVLMPAAITYAHRLVQRQSEMRKTHVLPWLRPDAKSPGHPALLRRQGGRGGRRGPLDPTRPGRGLQAPVRGGDGEHHPARDPRRVDPQGDQVPHQPHRQVRHRRPRGRLRPDRAQDHRRYLRRGMARHGGGAFSGKDPSKVDRSAAYAGRYVAKNIVAAGLADRCEIQVSYAIGVAEPTSISIETFGTAKIDEERIAQLVREHFDLRPYGIVKMLDLVRPIYRKTAAYGHFGREEPEFTWERTDRAEALRAAAGL